MNVVIQSGRIGNDPEEKVTQKGVTILRLSIAVEERFKSAEKWETRTHWFNWTYFNPGGVKKYLTKGREVLIEGRAERQKWQDREGNTRYDTAFIVRRLELGRPPKGASDAAPSNGPARPATRPRPRTARQEEDAIPF